LTQDLVDLEEKNHLNAQIQELKQGLQDALHQGALQKAEVIAMNLLQNNINMHVIVQSTGLTIEQIQELKHQETNRRTI
jgi:hypothetical protein